jgi:hypothetical protein
VLASAGALSSACTLKGDQAQARAPSRERAAGNATAASPEEWPPTEPRAADRPSGEGSIHIPTVGTLQFDAGEVTSVRPDIFQPGHLSLFDILVHLQERGDIDLDYHFDESADTHVIDSLAGDDKWWYEAHYSNGWFESNVWRMDMYPYKNNTTVRMRIAREERLEAIHKTFQEEVERLARHGGQVIIPDLQVRGPTDSWSYKDVLATPHDVRGDVLQPGLVTAMDVLISLKEQGQADALSLTWYEQIGLADPVDSYWVSRFNTAQAQGGCGFVYETGPTAFSGFSGAHIHIPADVRVLVSPEYALWFWLCL